MGNAADEKSLGPRCQTSRIYSPIASSLTIRVALSPSTTNRMTELWTHSWGHCLSQNETALSLWTTIPEKECDFQTRRREGSGCRQQPLHYLAIENGRSRG